MQPQARMPSRAVHRKNSAGFCKRFWPVTGTSEHHTRHHPSKSHPGLFADLHRCCGKVQRIADIPTAERKRQHFRLKENCLRRL